MRAEESEMEELRCPHQIGVANISPVNSVPRTDLLPATCYNNDHVQPNSCSSFPFAQEFLRSSKFRWIRVQLTDPNQGLSDQNLRDCRLTNGAHAHLHSITVPFILTPVNVFSAVTFLPLIRRDSFFSSSNPSLFCVQRHEIPNIISYFNHPLPSPCRIRTKGETSI